MAGRAEGRRGLQNSPCRRDDWETCPAPWPEDSKTRAAPTYLEPHHISHTLRSLSLLVSILLTRELKELLVAIHVSGLGVKERVVAVWVDSCSMHVSECREGAGGMG